MSEKDPNGLEQHSPGAKLDDGKMRYTLILHDMSRAIRATVEIAEFGAQKYTPGGWMHVEDGIARYTNALYRHLQAEPTQPTDPETGLLHAAHAAWNALARLELMLREGSSADEPENHDG